MSEPITLADIRASKPAEAAVRAFGKSCRVVELPPAQRDELDTAMHAYKEEHGEDEYQRMVTVFWVAHTLRGADGARVIPDDAMADLAATAGSRDFRRLFRAAMDVNGVAEDDGADGSDP